MHDKLKNIKLFISDVDGVMTDATIWLDSNMKWKRKFNVLDGMGLIRLMKQGIKVGIITASDADDVRFRFEFLKVDYFYEKSSDKGLALQDLLKKTGFDLSEIAYIGDDLMDLPVIEAVGFGVAVPNSLEEVQAKADYVTKRAGGEGAVREVCEMILRAKR